MDGTTMWFVKDNTTIFGSPNLFPSRARDSYGRRILDGENQLGLDLQDSTNWRIWEENPWGWNQPCGIKNPSWESYEPLLETNIASSPLKMDGWNTIVSFWGAKFSGAMYGYVSFTEGIIPQAEWFCSFWHFDMGRFFANFSPPIQYGVTSWNKNRPDAWMLNNYYCKTHPWLKNMKLQRKQCTIIRERSN